MHDSECVLVESATESDAVEITALYLAARLEALPVVRPVHADSEVLDWIRNVLLKRGETVVAVVAAQFWGLPL
jgi:hypothetical protein